MAIKSFLSEGGFSVGSVGVTPVEVVDRYGNVTAQTISGTHLTLSGNLIVNGSTVTVNSTTVTVDDPIFTIGGDTAPASNDSKDRGIEFRWHNGTAAKVGFFGYDNSTGKFIFIADATNTSEVFSGTAGQIDLSGSIVAGGGITFDASTGTITNNGVQSIAGTANQVFVNGITNAVNGNVTLTLPQNIHTGATPTFSTLTLGGDVLTFSGSGVTAYTNDTARIYNQAGVGPTINGNIFQVRTGATGSLALNIGNNQNSTFSGIVTVNGSGSSIISDSLGIGGAAYYSAKFTVDGNAIGYSWGITNARGGHTTSISNPDGGTTSSNIAFKVANSSGTTLIQSTYGGAITIPGATTISNTLTVNTSPVTLSNSGANPNFRAIDGSIITKLQSQSVGDTTGAIGTESNHTLKLITNNAARVTIDTSGNVGVGTTSPTYKLHVVGDARLGANGQRIWLYDDGNAHIHSTSAPLWINSDDSSGVYVNAQNNGNVILTNYTSGTGRVGIGTGSPSTRLHVSGGAATIDSNINDGLRLSTTLGNGNNLNIRFDAPDSNGTNRRAFLIWQPQTSNTGRMSIMADSATEQFTVVGSGNVGIGTTTPGATLEISKAGATDNRFIRLTDTSASGRSWDLINRAGNSAGNFGIYDNTAGAYRFWIDTSGNIGINTTSPSNKLDVNGSVRTNDWYYVDGSGFGMYNNATAMYFSTNSNSRWNFSSGQSSIGLRLYSGGHNNTWRAHFYGDSTGQGFLDSSDNWQMYVDSSSRLRVFSGIYNAETGIRILNPGGAAYVTQTSLITGAFKIRLPVDRFKSNTMMRMTVKIYQYSTGNSYEFEIGGYNYSDAGATWYNIFAEQKSDVATAPLQVRFGNDGTANCIWIGETNTAWSYPQVFVTEFQGGYSGTTAGWASGWSISAVTTFDTVTHNRTASQVATANNISTLINNAGNLTIGGTINIVGDANSGTPDLYFNNAGGFGSASGQVRAYAPNNSSLAYYWDASYVTYYNSIRVVDGSSNVKVYLDSSTGSSYFNGGNLGVGTTTPLKKLTVYNGTAVIHGETAGAASINESTYGLVIAPLIQRSSTVGNYYPGIAFNHLYQYSGQGTTTYNANAHGWIGLRLTDTTGTERSSLVFATKTGTGNPGLDLPAERMCIRHDGNVGIGATDPGHKLEVSGNVLATKVFVGTANASYDLYNNGTSYLNGAVNTGGALTVGTNLTVGSGGGVTGLTLTQNWRLRRENATTGDFILDESGVDKLRITSTGNATLAGNLTVGTSSKINWSSSAQFESPSNGVVTISSNNGSYPGYLNVGGIQSWDGVIALSIGTGTGHVTANANLTVTGSLIVNGTTTTVNSTTATVKDPIITLGGGNAGTAASSDDNKDRGIEFKWHNGTAAKTGFFGFQDSTGYLTFIPDATNTSEVFSGTLGDIQATNFRGNLIGNVTGNVSGTAGGETLATVTGRGSSTSTAITLSNTANHYAGHHYFDAYDSAGNHYPHYQAGSDGTGAIANIRVGQSGGTHKVFILNGKDGAISWNGNTVWHAGNDGSGSGLDADLLDGYNQDTANTANTVVRRDGSGNFSAGTISAANIGIGIASPSGLLNILAGTGTADGTVAIKIGGPSNYASLELGTTNNYDGFIRSYGNDLKYYAGHFRTVGNTASENHRHYWYTSKNGSADWSTAKMLLTEDGYLGIGTGFTPTAKLHVSGGRTYLSSSDGYELAFARSSSYFYFYNDGNNTTGKLTLTDTAGISNPIITFTQDTRNVGIGTTSPAHKLHILSSAGQDGINIDAVTYPEIVLYRNSVVKAYIGIAGNAGGYTVSPGSLADSLVVRSENAIHLAPAAGGYVSLTAATNGNVGIGTTSPSSKLHVQEVGTDGTPAIRITTTSAPSTFSWATSAINSSLTVGKNYIHLIGQAESSKNSGYIGFNFQSSGSNSNLLTFGHYGADNLFNISAGGSVGIGTGTSALGYKLEVSGAIGTYGLMRLGSTDYTTSVVLSVAPGVVNFDAPGVSGGRFKIDSSGNVGIGVVSPRVLLDLAKTNNSGQVILIGETAANNRVGFGLDSATASMRLFTVNAAGQFFDFGGISSSDGSTWTRNHRLAVAGGNSWLNEQGGNVGIGTASPSVKLHVAGSAIVANNTSINPDSYLNQVVAGAISTGGWGVSSAIGGSGNTGHAWAIGTNSTRLYFAYGDGASTNTLQSFIEVNTNRNMTLMPTSGSIGVGTASPSYKLHVAGDIYASSGAIRVNSTNSFYFETYGGGWFMQDTTWIRSTNDKSVWVNTGLLGSNGGLTVGYGGTTPPSGGAIIAGNVGIGVSSTSYKLEVNGSFAATTKSFVIPHPTKPGKKLRYGSLEGPENGVYVRGRLKGSNTIELPDYWEKLVDPDSITVNLTPIGKHQKLYVDSVSYKRVIVEKEGLFSGEIDCYYTIFAERIDVEKLQVEIDAK